MAVTLEQINDSVTKFLMTPPTKDLYANIVDEAVKLVGATYGSIVLLENGVYKRVCASNPIAFKAHIFKGGVLDRAFTKQEVIVSHIEDLLHVSKPIQKFGIKSLIFIPLVYKGESIGILSINLKKHVTRTAQELQVLKLFGSLATIVIRYKHLTTETQQANEKKEALLTAQKILERIYKASLKFLEPLDEAKTYATIGKQAVKLVSGNDASIILANNGQFERVYSTSKDARGITWRRNDYTVKSYRENKTFLVHANQSDDINPKIAQKGIQSFLFIPLSYRNQTMGVLQVRSKENQRFSEHELEILRIFGSMASIAIRKTQLYSEIKKTLEIRNNFVSLAAHELRTPLTSIYGYAQLLAKKLTNPSAKETQWAQALLAEVDRLSHLTHEILEANRIQAGNSQYVWEHENIKTLVDHAKNQITERFPNRQIVIRDEQLNADSSHIIGDEKKLTSVFVNLLDNAVKFSDPSTPITITLKPDTTGIAITIQDLGIGIDKKDIHHIFGEFYKSQDNFQNGMGLGLYIAKFIVRQHRGDIKIKSEKNIGTEIMVQLPKANYDA